MQRVLSRRAFLQARFVPAAKSIHPPWSAQAARFEIQCNRCGACTSVCPEGIIVAGEGGLPLVDFSRGECVFCGECVQQCATGALKREREDSLPWKIRPRISQDCLTHQGVVCGVCREQCELEAIEMQYHAHSVQQPSVNESSCTGCGACVATCPVSAIQMTHTESIRPSDIHVEEVCT